MKLIETERLILRPFTLDYLEELYRLFNQPAVMQYMGGIRSRQVTQERLQQMIEHWQHGFGMWAVHRQTDNQMLGRCGLIYLDNTPEVEIGYTFFQQYWGQGFATEAGFASLNYGFNTVKLKRIVAITHPENLASQGVMKRLGMKYEKDGIYYCTPVVYYSISAPDFYLKFPPKLPA